MPSYSIRPPSLLDEEDWNPWLTGGGLLLTLVVHVAVPYGFIVGLAWWRTWKPPTQAPTAPVVMQVIEARVARLGTLPQDLKQLPDRQVPRLSTTPGLTAAAAPPPPPSKAAAPPPPDAVTDDLQRLGDRAQAFAEIAETQEREGDPEGSADSNAQNAETGNVYAGRLQRFIQRGWTTPTLIGVDELGALMAQVTIAIDAHGVIGDGGLQRSSGNAIFDQSAVRHIRNLRGQHIPEPPEASRHIYYGQSVGINFHGKH